MRTVLTDRAAAALSSACIIHCLALPLLATILPFAAVVADMAWIHWLFALLAIAASLHVAMAAASARACEFVLPAGSGALFLIAGLLAPWLDWNETVLTVTGGCLMALAHGIRLLRHR